MRPSLLLACILSATAAAETVQERVATVTNTPGLVAFWDFTKREATGKRFTAHVPSGATSDYALDAGNYVKDLWVSVGQAWVRGQGTGNSSRETRQVTAEIWTHALPVPRATVPQATQKQASEQIRRRVLAEFLIGHLLHGLLSCPVDLTAYPAILGVGVNAEFDGAVVGG